MVHDQPAASAASSVFEAAADAVVDDQAADLGGKRVVMEGFEGQRYTPSLLMGLHGHRALIRRHKRS